MKKISKKNIRIRHFKEISAFDSRNFFVGTFDNIIDIINLKKIKNLNIFKKSLFNYFLPGQFKDSVKNYIKKYSYINYNLNNNLLIDIINTETIVLFKYKNFVFFNNLNIFKYKTFFNMFFYLLKKKTYKMFFLFCLFF